MNMQGVEEQFSREGSNELLHVLGKGTCGLGKGREEVTSELLGTDVGGSLFFLFLASAAAVFKGCCL